MPFPEPASGSIEPPAPAASPTTPPFSAGTVISRAFTVWFRNFGAFSVVTLVLYAPVFAIAVLAPAEGSMALDRLDQIVSGLVSLVVTGALTYGVLESLQGGRAGIGALLRLGFAKLGTVFAVSFRVGLWIVLGVLLLIVPAVMWYCALYVAVPAAVVEPELPGSADALKRSRELTKGQRWAIFVVVVVTTLVTLVVGAAIGVAIVFTRGLPHPLPGVVATAIQALVTPLGACAAAVAYHDLRVAKEGIATADLVKVFE